MNITVELVYELPWERSARLAALNKFPAGSFTGFFLDLADKKQKTQEKTTLSGRSLLDPNWLPRTGVSGNEFDLERPIKPTYLALPDLNTAPVGARIRFLRKRRGLTVLGLADATGVSHNAISNLERGAVPPKPWTLGPILSFFGAEAAGIFPGAADAFDAVVPPTDFGAWLNNFRLRNGLQLKDVALRVGVSAVSIHYYEQARRKPGPDVIKRLRRAFKLNGELDRFL